MDPARITRLLVPSLCPLCRHPAEPEAEVCGTCMRELNRAPVLRGEPPEGVGQVVSCADHDGVARALLAAFKFRRLTGLAGLIAGFMADAAGAPSPGTLLVPVPSARLRTWLRGYDPVGMLATEVAERTGLTLPREAVLIRRGSGRQRGRGRSGRLSDPPDIRPGADAASRIGGRDTLLVDDVMTTGATLAAAAGVLRLSGAASVNALTFTRRL